MNLELKTLAEKWEYIQGGFLFLDENRTDSSGSLLALADGELRYFIASLNAADLRAAELIDYLNLTADAVSFKEVPESLKQMLASDIVWLKEDGGEYDASFGSLAMILFYESVCRHLEISSPKTELMRNYAETQVNQALPDVRISW